MKEIKAFVDTLIPAKLPEERKAELAAELESHLYEKVDFYMEIGYSQDESTKKAIDDFAEDESVRNGIFNEFERLYRERTWWAFAAAGVVFAMNVIAFVSGNWIYSADFNEYPNSAGALVSLMMVFVLLFGIVSARILRFRKMLVGIGTACLTVGGFLVWCFFPQVAAYTLSINLWYLIDLLTPFVASSLIWESFIYAMFSFLLVCALYCFVEAYRIRRGKARTGKRAWRKAAIFTAVYLAVTAVSCVILPSAQRYEDNLPIWFNMYHTYVCEEVNALFDEIQPGESYESARTVLTNHGWTNIDSYKTSLDRVAKKHFLADLKKCDFPDGYEIWFQAEENPGGNGFFALKRNENNVVVSTGIGNVFEKMYYSDRYGASFMYSDSHRNDDVKLMESAFHLLAQGAEEAEIMGFFGTDAHRELGDMHGEIYTKFRSIDNGALVTYYRVYSYGLTDPYAKDYDRYSDIYFEFTFVDGGLSEAKMHRENDAYDDGVKTVLAF